MGKSPAIHAISTQTLGSVVAGGLATAIHWTVMASLVAATVDSSIATAAGSLSGAVANYGLQRRIAFPRAPGHGTSIRRYLASCALAWHANLALFYLLSEKLPLPVIPAQLLTTALVTALNLVVYRRFVFHEHAPQIPDARTR